MLPERVPPDPEPAADDDQDEAPAEGTVRATSTIAVQAVRSTRWPL